MKRLAAVLLFVLVGCGGAEPLVSAAGTWTSSVQTNTSTASLTMSLTQDDAGNLSGPATFGNASGTVTGNINGPENAYLVLRFQDEAIVMQVAGLPLRMFGSAYVNGASGVAVEAIRH